MVLDGLHCIGFALILATGNSMFQGFHKDLFLAHCFFSFISMIFLRLHPSYLFFLFADDTSIYHESGNLEQLQKVVNNELKYVKELDANKLALDVDKTSFIILQSPKKASK